MPKLPTAEEIRRMPDSKYESYHSYLLNLCYQSIGASYAVVSDSADIRKKYPEVRDYLDNLHDYYSQLTDQLQEALDWIFKVRYGIK